jgi:hypothetical protein
MKATHAFLNICKIIGVQKQLDDIREVLPYVWYQVLNHSYREHFNVMSVSSLSFYKKCGNHDLVEAIVEVTMYTDRQN